MSMKNLREGISWHFTQKTGGKHFRAIQLEKEGRMKSFLLFSSIAVSPRALMASAYEMEGGVGGVPSFTLMNIL